MKKTKPEFSVDEDGLKKKNTCITIASTYNWYLDYGMIITLQTGDSVITQSSMK